MPSTNGHGPKRAILYARVSTDEQARSDYSLAQQLEALREYAAREGYDVLEEVQDPGQSGASLKRPGMDRVRDLVVSGGVAVVLAQDRDCFAREPAYHYLLKREFEEHGTKIRALNDRGDESPEGELTDGILDQLAKYEKAKIAERTRRGKLRKAREGKVIAGRAASYGRAALGFEYNESRDGLVLDDERMLFVKRMFYIETLRTATPSLRLNMWLDKLAEVSRKRARYQEMAAEDLIGFDELRLRIAELEETRTLAERELRALRGRQEQIQQLEEDKKALLDTYAGMLPDALDSLDGPERHRVYKMLRVEATIAADGSLEVSGDVSYECQ